MKTSPRKARTISSDTQSNELPWRAENGALFVDVRLTPNASKDKIEGIDQLSDGKQVLKARVRAIPEKGAANTALIKLLAKSCGVPKSSVDLEKGATARIKTLRLDGDPAEIAAKLAELCEV